METFAWQLARDTFHLGSCAWEFPLGHYRLKFRIGSLTWDLALWSFLETFVWDPWLGIPLLGEMGILGLGEPLAVHRGSAWWKSYPQYIEA